MKTVLSNWTPEQWTAVITAVITSLTGMVVSIINAFQHQALAKKVTDNHAETLAALPPKGTA